MQRKTLLIAAMTATAAFAGFVVAGTAFGAAWHEYDGRLSAGQAYVVPVPAGADTLSFQLMPIEGATAAGATLVVFDPNDARVGYFEIENDGSADVVEPLAGAYVAYVYDIREAALTVRLQANVAEDFAFELTKADTHRADKPIVRGADGGALAKDVTAEISGNPVFATILYQGTVTELNAVLASPAGEVLRVSGESGTSYAPGLSVGAAPARDANLANVVNGRYTAHVEAADFDGTMYLTTLAIERPVAPIPLDAHAKKNAPKAPQAPAEPAIEPVGAALPAGVPMAVEVIDSELLLALPSYFCAPVEEDAKDEDAKDEDEDAKDEEEEDEEEPEGVCARFEDAHKEHGGFFPTPWSGDYGYYGGEHAVVSVYDGLDNLVAVVNLHSEEPSALLEDLEAGEYVFFVHGYADPESEDAMQAAAYLVKPDAVDAAIVARPVALVEGAMEIAGESPLGYENGGEIEMATPPLALGAWLTEGSIAADYRISISNAADAVVFEAGELVHAPIFWGGPGFAHAYDMEGLTSGTYTATISATSFQGATQIAWITYDRAFAFGEGPAVEDADEAEDEDGDEQGASPAKLVTDLIGL